MLGRAIQDIQNQIDAGSDPVNLDTEGTLEEAQTLLEQLLTIPPSE